MNQSPPSSKQAKASDGNLLRTGACVRPGEAKRLTLTPSIEVSIPRSVPEKGKEGETNGGKRPSLLLQCSKLGIRGGRKNLVRPTVRNYAFSSAPGASSPGVAKTNQDAVCAMKGFRDGWHWFCVMDGHGPCGHSVSTRVKQKLPEFVSRALDDCGDVPEALRRGFREAHKDLSNSGIDIVCSGTTCVACVLRGSTVHVANVGDSRAILGRQDASGVWSAEPLTTDHKLDLEEERARIEKAGGRIFPLIGEDGQFYGPQRVWLPEHDIPGLAMSRSLGDSLAATVGVTAEPDVRSIELLPEHRFLLLASDGVWEFISDLEAVEIVRPFVASGNSAAACRALQKRSAARWRKEDDGIDDISSIVVMLENPQPKAGWR